MCESKQIQAVKTTLSGFNGYPSFLCRLVRPERYHQFIPQLPNCIARGSGSSYSDAAVNTDGIVISTSRLNRFLAFDRERGILTAEAGVTFKEICELIVPAGWFLPVVPGTFSVSLGGAVCADIHGKNHFQQGTLSQHVIWLELITASLECIRCSANEEADLFWATVGGMGLTGLIGVVCLKLQRIMNPYMTVKTQATVNLEQTVTALNDSSAEYEYSVAWLDGGINRQWGRGVVMAARHSVDLVENLQNNSKNNSSFSIPIKSPINLIRPLTVSCFNDYYYRNKKNRAGVYCLHYQDYFSPLDKIKHWPYFYGRKGFVQYQCVFPLEYASEGIEKLFAIFHREHILCSLVVLKRFGAENNAPLSFAREGITIAIDMPYTKKLPLVLQQADELVVTHGGRVYLAKDTRLSKEMFMKMYPNYLSWMKVKQRVDPNNIFQSSLSLRLM